MSKRFHDLAGDSELWKHKYYTRWVQPRLRQALRFKQSMLPLASTYSPRVSKWPGHGHLATDGNRLNWKTQFRLRHNWSKGICRFGVLEVSRPPLPQIHMKLFSGVVVTADEEHGLRAWSTKASRKQLTALSFPHEGDKPTALFTTRGSSVANIEVTVGFEDGHFDIYDLDVAMAKFVLRFSQASTSSTDDASITAIASSPPFLLTISQYKVFSLYRIPYSSANAPTLLASLESNNTFAPISLSLRCSASEVIASIAYSFFHISGGWTVGIQELRFNQDGERIGSRLASAAAQREGGTTSSADSTDVSTASSHRLIRHMEAPTSISYSHPYLLTSHSDNTLTMYLVASSSDKLSIRTGRRLWGHTSSVTSVQVGDRGKAVSISPRGNEIRIWELETAVSARFSNRSRPNSTREESSVQITSEQAATAGVSVETASGAMNRGREIVQAEYEAPMPAKVGGCVMFDEEQVVVLSERDCRAQLLECYDFT